jgi:hypothetical protein
LVNEAGLDDGIPGPVSISFEWSLGLDALNARVMGFGETLVPRDTF